MIIDEAHYAATDSNRADFAKAIRERCDSLLLLTATPHSGNPDHFFNLLHLIDSFMFATPEDLDRNDARERIDKVMIRRGKETIFELNEQGELVKKFKDRQPHSIEVEFSAREWELYDAVSGYTSAEWSKLIRKRSIAETDRNIGKFLLTLVQKRMVSSIFALHETLQRRIESIVEERTVSKIEQPDKKQLKRALKEYEQRGDFMDDEDRELVERYLEIQKIQASYAERTNEVKKLRALLEQTRKIIEEAHDSKFRWLQEFLKELLAKNPREKVIVFTEYRDTLNYLKSQLEKTWILKPEQIVIIQGGMPLGEDENEVGSKLHAEWRFNDPDTNILLATDAASEGLNLQRFCHTLINYELPWNPNRLEQRIGRIHRYGQRQVAQVYNLMIKHSKEAEIFQRLQKKIEIIRKQLGSMAEVLGVLEQISLDEVIMKVLDRSMDEHEVEAIAENELARMEEISRKLQKTHFLSGCRQFTREDIHHAEDTIANAQKAIPQHRDVQVFVETFLRIFGDRGQREQDGRKLHPAQHQGVYRLLVPSLIQDDKLPKIYPRVTFERSVAIRDWLRAEEPDFLAFGHPLLDRMISYCRKAKAADLGGKLTSMVTDYAGLPGVIFNFLLRFEDQLGNPIREELEPVFVDQEGHPHEALGRQLFLGQGTAEVSPNPKIIKAIRKNITTLQQAAEGYIREQYQAYYARVEQKRNQDLAILLEDLQRFDQGVIQYHQERLEELRETQLTLFDDPSIKGQRTRIENDIKRHQYQMGERRAELEKMRIGAFPAPELLNMVIAIPL